jgi:hypothetical protein
MLTGLSGLQEKKAGLHEKTRPAMECLFRLRFNANRKDGLYFPEKGARLLAGPCPRPAFFQGIQRKPAM